ncbi:MAG: MBL fold metallo-hydrolase [Erysipelotrichaceae bacterium]|nr:MBL fold metallo-hydrolase [Erysipelotrichaceae bacterium]
MARKDSEHQKTSMSLLFRGRDIFKPLNTGRIDERVSCVREWVANIFFYTKNGTTIMIDAGYNYPRLREKMGWLDIDPASIRHILITHQDTDHVGALERDSECLFRDAEVYIGETENRYLTGEVRRKVMHRMYKLPLVKMDNHRTLLQDGQVFFIDGIKIECMEVPGHTWGHMVYLIDEEYLFTGDTIWFGADGGYSFLSTLAEDNDLSLRSLRKLERVMRARQWPIKVITGHTGWADDPDFVFAHTDELCMPFRRHYHDPDAPYDGYVETDDTEESARSVLLAKKNAAAERYRIEHNSVQETLVIPLYGRLICSEHYPALFEDREAEKICRRLDYDFSAKRRIMETPAGLFGALEVAQRQYDLLWEVKDYLKDHPQAAVVNLGCGLDDTFAKADNGQCRGYNIDLPDVIAVRDALLACRENEVNIACDLNDHAWMDRIDGRNGAVFFAAGVFYYLQKDDVRRLLQAMAERFPGAVLVFDVCNRKGARMMTKTWLKGAGIQDVNALFSLEDEQEITDWSARFASVTARSYMRGYRDIFPEVSAFHKLMIRFCDRAVKMKIIRVAFKEEL